MAKGINRDIAFAGHCVAAWRHGFVAASPGGGAGPLAMHLGAWEEAVVETWMHNSDNVMLASLIRLLENTLKDIREHDAAILLPVEALQPTTTVTETTFVGRRAVAPGHRHQLLYTTLGLANKFDPADAAGELLEAFAVLWACVEDLERGRRVDWRWICDG